MSLEAIKDRKEPDSKKQERLYPQIPLSFYRCTSEYHSVNCLAAHYTTLKDDIWTSGSDSNRSEAISLSTIAVPVQLYGTVAVNRSPKFRGHSTRLI